MAHPAPITMNRLVEALLRVDGTGQTPPRPRHHSTPVHAITNPYYHHHRYSHRSDTESPFSVIYTRPTSASSEASIIGDEPYTSWSVYGNLNTNAPYYEEELEYPRGSDAGSVFYSAEEEPEEAIEQVASPIAFAPIGDTFSADGSPLQTIAIGPALIGNRHRVAGSSYNYPQAREDGLIYMRTRRAKRPAPLNPHSPPRRLYSPPPAAPPSTPIARFTKFVRQRVTSLNIPLSTAKNVKLPSLHTNADSTPRSSRDSKPEPERWSPRQSRPDHDHAKFGTTPPWGVAVKESKMKRIWRRVKRGLA